MKYAVVSESLERFVKDNWTLTEIAFEDVAFNADLYSEFVKLNIQLGTGEQTSVTIGHYRQIGMIFITVHVKPGSGSARKLELADLAAQLLTSRIVQPVPPLVAPAVNLRVPDITTNIGDSNGWSRAQVSCPFYYDWSN